MERFASGRSSGCSIFEFLAGLVDVIIGDDIVTLKNFARLVTADCHRNLLANTPANHVADGAFAQIMHEKTRDACREL